MIKGLLKKFLPEHSIEFLSVHFHRAKSYGLSVVMPRRHLRQIKKIKNKERIRVVFLAIHGSVWKYDSVFERMVRDPYFEPEILVCPDFLYGEDQMLSEMYKTFEHFKTKGYKVRKSRRDDGSWLPLSDLSPDLVVFTNPHELTVPPYYAKAYSRYLTIYVPYFFMATVHATEGAFSTPMLNAMWRIYWPHQFAYGAFNALSQGDGMRSSRLTGYPAVEALLTPNHKLSSQAWKSQSGKKKIIYAPHHSITNDESSLSTFLRLGVSIKKIAEHHYQQVQWSFKPHPHLKPRLYLHPAWGKERTDQYFAFWESQEHTQLNEGEYDDLFTQSDAIIHDCSSFIAEYAVTRKPALYLLSESSQALEFVNEFGECALQTYDTASSAPEINKFILNVVRDKNTQRREKTTCFDEYLSEFYGSEMPSDRILKDIKVALGVSPLANQNRG